MVERIARYSETPRGMMQGSFKSPVRLERDVGVDGLRLRFVDWPGLRGPALCVGYEPGFDPLALKLTAAGWRVVALQERPGGFGYLDRLNDLATLIDTFGFQPCVLLGQSLGAVVALLFAAWRPGHVERLVLLDDPAELVANATAGASSDPAFESLRLAPPAIEALWPRVDCPVLRLDQTDPRGLSAEVFPFLVGSAL